MRFEAGCSTVDDTGVSALKQSVVTEDLSCRGPINGRPACSLSARVGLVEAVALDHVTHRDVDRTPVLNNQDVGKLSEARST